MLQIVTNLLNCYKRVTGVNNGVFLEFGNSKIQFWETSYRKITYSTGTKSGIREGEYIMPRYEKVTAICCYEKDISTRYPLLNEGLSYCYRIHYLTVRRGDCKMNTLIDYRYEKVRPYSHDTVESMINDILSVLHSNHYTVRKWIDFGKLYYDIIFVDIHNPLHVEHYAVTAG